MRVEEGLDFAAAIARRVASGRLPRETAEIALAEGLCAECPACTANYDRAIADLYGPPKTTASTVASLPFGMAQVASFLAHATPPTEADQRSPAGRKARRKPVSLADQTARAEKALAELLPAQWARRKERVTLEWHRFRGSVIARLFLTEARAALPGSPEDSARWSDLALLALGGTRAALYPDPHEKSVLRLRARLFQANALRCRGELVAAHEEFSISLSIAEELDIRDFAFWVEAKSFLTSLRIAQRDFPTAIREARSGAALARALSEKGLEVRVRWQLSTIYEQIGDFSAALNALRQALESLSDLRDPVLEMGIRHLEVNLLARTGHFQKASVAFEALQPLYDHFPDRQNFRLWSASLIAAGLGRFAEAETSYQAARDGFLAAKNAYDAALVTLDWTLFLLDQNRPEEVLPLAVSMGQAFEGLGVARETLASWNVFAEAAARQELTRTAAEGLVRSLGSERAAPQKPR
ncbi:MAG: hypothetical protein SF066_22185 [Thermoanaerobaculia bacterium]|nr:hypothetical protein [Thermoanaerobaculia bacterium]